MDRWKLNFIAGKEMNSRCIHFLEYRICEIVNAGPRHESVKKFLALGRMSRLRHLEQAGQGVVRILFCWVSRARLQLGRRQGRGRGSNALSHKDPRRVGNAPGKTAVASRAGLRARPARAASLMQTRHCVPASGLCDGKRLRKAIASVSSGRGAINSAASLPAGHRRRKQASAAHLGDSS